MEYRKMGRTGLKVSAFCLGTMTFGRQVEEKESLRIIDGALDAANLQALPGVIRVLENGHDGGGGEFSLYASQAQPALKALLELSERHGFGLRGLTVEGATLEDVFIQLTGRSIRA